MSATTIKEDKMSVANKLRIGFTGFVFIGAFILNMVLPIEDSRMAWLIGYGLGALAVLMVFNIRAMVRTDRKMKALDDFSWLLKNHPDHASVMFLERTRTYHLDWGDSGFSKAVKNLRESLEVESR